MAQRGKTTDGNYGDRPWKNSSEPRGEHGSALWREDHIATYRMRAERTFHKCLKELQAYQAAHPLEEPVLQNKAKSGKPEVKNEPKLVEFHSKNKLHKIHSQIGPQTQ